MSEESKDAWVYVAVPVEGNEKDENFLVHDSSEDEDILKKEKEPVINDKMLWWILIGMLLATFILTNLVGRIAFGSSESMSSQKSRQSDGGSQVARLVDKIPLQKKNYKAQAISQNWASGIENYQDSTSDETLSNIETLVVEGSSSSDNEQNLRRALMKDPNNEIEYKQNVALLTPATIDDFLTQNEMTYLYFRVKHHQCRECRKLAPVMKAFANQAKDLSVGVGFVDCDKYGLLCASLDLDTFPTLRFYFRNDPSLEHRSVVHLSPKLPISHNERVSSLVNLSERLIAQNKVESMDDATAEQRDLRIVA